MRTATPETLRALRRAIGSTPYSRWAKANGIAPVTIHDALKGRPMSARRENVIRAALDLPPLRWQMVEIAEGQRVVTCTPPTANRRRAATLPPDEAARLDAMARRLGYRSTGAMLIGELKRNGLLEPL